MPRGKRDILVPKLVAQNVVSALAIDKFKILLFRHHLFI